MKNLLSNKPLLLGLAGLLVVLLVGGFIFLRGNNSNAPGEEIVAEEEIPSISPEELGFSIELSKDGREVILTVEKTEDIEALEYELSYTSEGDIPRGALGNIEIEEPGEPVVQEITLGTCSDTCHYDKEVSNIKVLIKVTKTDGKVYSSELSID